MKIGTWGKATLYIFIFINSSFSFSCYYRTPRQITQMAIRIGRQHNKVRQNQQKLLKILKDSASGLQSKPEALHCTATAIGNKTRFKPFLREQKVIQELVAALSGTPQFPKAFTRVIEGAAQENAANFNGAIAELQVALRKSKEGKKIKEFNRVIRDENNKIATEIDLVLEDDYGQEYWCEVKSCKKAEKKIKREW